MPTIVEDECCIRVHPLTVLCTHPLIVQPCRAGPKARDKELRKRPKSCRLINKTVPRMLSLQGVFRGRFREL